MFDGELACIEGVCVLVSVGDPTDTLRRKILGLLYKQNGVVKRADIMETLGAGAPSQHVHQGALGSLHVERKRLDDQVHERMNFSLCTVLQSILVYYGALRRP